MMWRDGGTEELEHIAEYISTYAKTVKVKKQMLTLEDYIKAINNSA